MITLIVPTIFLGFFPSWVIDFLWDAPNLLYIFIVYRTFIKISIPWL
jgi:hypothetical protein